MAARAPVVYSIDVVHKNGRLNAHHYALFLDRPTALFFCRKLRGEFPCSKVTIEQVVPGPHPEIQFAGAKAYQKQWGYQSE